MTKITVEKTKYLELTLQARLARLAHAKGLHSAVAGDLARRALETGRFDLDQDGELLERQSLSEWLNDLETSGQAAHFFQKVAAPQPQEAAPYGGFSKAAFDKLSPERKLAIANEVQARKRAS